MSAITNLKDRIARAKTIRAAILDSPIQSTILNRFIGFGPNAAPESVMEGTYYIDDFAIVSDYQDTLDVTGQPGQSYATAYVSESSIRDVLNSASGAIVKFGVGRSWVLFPSMPFCFWQDFLMNTPDAVAIGWFLESASLSVDTSPAEYPVGTVSVPYLSVASTVRIGVAGFITTQATVLDLAPSSVVTGVAQPTVDINILNPEGYGEYVERFVQPDQPFDPDNPTP